MTIDTHFAFEDTELTESEALDLKERMIALSERICALAEAANILAEASAPFRTLSLATVDGSPTPTPTIDGAAALAEASRKLEAARIEAVNEFTTLKVKLGSYHH